VLLVPTQQTGHTGFRVRILKNTSICLWDNKRTSGSRQLAVAIELRNHVHGLWLELSAAEWTVECERDVAIRVSEARHRQWYEDSHGEPAEVDKSNTFSICKKFLSFGAQSGGLFGLSDSWTHAVVKWSTR
jgi:hypothetical protein